MTLKQELGSWIPPTQPRLSPIPGTGSKAPSSAKLELPRKDGKPVIITFLRHCGCPFAEKTLLELAKTAKDNPSITCIAISHSSQDSTEKWLQAVGGQGDLSSVIVDQEREAYAQWGLGISSYWHVLNPASLWSVYTLGSKEKIWNRPTESGSRWQMGGSFAIDGNGVVRWAKVAGASDDVPDFGEAVKALG